jgi:hypothetical protein
MFCQFSLRRTPNGPPPLGSLCKEAGKAIRYLSLAFKSAGYKEEREIRVLTGQMTVSM